MRILSIDRMIQSQRVTRILRKSTPALVAAVMAGGLLASASRGLAAGFTWTNTVGDVWTSATAWQTNLVDVYTNNAGTPVDLGCQPDVNAIVGGHTTNLVTCGGGGSGGFPSLADSARFTNNTTYAVTVNAPAGASGITFSNTAGVVTMGAGVNTLTVTGNIAVADGSATSTVYWSSGTLSVGTAGNTAIGHLAVGANNTNSLGYFAVTNGTVGLGPLTQVGRSGAASVGTFVISGPGVVTNAIGESGSFQVRGLGTGQSSQLIISNGGKLFMQPANASAMFEATSNGVLIVSGTNSVLNAGTSTASSLITIGNSTSFSAATTPGSLMIVSNGASVLGGGTISWGRGSSFNTGIVCGAGSRLLSTSFSGSGGNLILGITDRSSSNDLVVYNGGYLSCDGSLSVGNGSLSFNDSLHMGGSGAMSTGSALVVRNNSATPSSLIQVSNAVLSCGQMVIAGNGNNVLNVLAGGTLILTNSYLVSPTLTNVLEIETSGGPGGALTINAGTVSAVSGSNAFQIVIGQTIAVAGNSVTITNGGKLLSEQIEVGANSSYSTGLVSGVGTVWSNYTAGAGYVGTNEVDIGIGTSGAGSYNYLAIQNGASFVNNGDLLIGDSASSTFNSVVLGGPGALATIVNVGSITIGGSAASYGNTLTISNATISTSIFREKDSNTVVFSAGTLSTQGADIDPGANGSNEFVVGDGTDAAYYDMAAGGNGYHIFGSPGLVVTNGASLRGSGTISGTTTVLGTFVPGFANTVGSIYCSNSLSFGDFATLDYDLGTLSDSVTVNGNLKLGGTLNVTAAGGFGPGSYTLFTYAGTLSAFGTLTVGSTPDGSLTYTVDTNTAGSVFLDVTGASSPYSTWTSHYGLSGGNALGTADPDGDGMNNTNEFLAGFSPTSSAAYLHIISVAKTNTTDIKVIYLGANGDSTYSGGPASRTNVLEFTTGTANGSYSTNSFASTGQTNVLSGGTGLGVVTNMVDSGGATNKPSRYYRVRVLLP